MMLPIVLDPARVRIAVVGRGALAERRLAAALAGKFEPRLAARQRQNARIDQRVVHDDIGLRQAGERIERQQAGIARAGAGEPHASRREDRQVRIQEPLHAPNLARRRPGLGR